MHDRVVLKEHRQSRVATEQRVTHVLAVASQSADRDGDGCLARDADLQIGGAVAAVDFLEAPQQVIAQSLGHAFAARESEQSVLLERKSLGLTDVDEMLEERRIAADEIRVLRTEKAERV